MERRIKDANLRKSYDLVFDYRTLMVLYHLISKRHLATVDYPISTGKEAVLFHATGVDGTPYALKVYMISHAPFKSMIDYIIGDPRFKGLRGKREEIIYAWASKEYKNLQRLYKGGVRVPMPFYHMKNTLIMEYIGDEEYPAPTMKDFFAYLKKEGDLDEIYKLSQKFFERIVVDIITMVKNAKLVHGDLSEYNILVWPTENDYEIVIIDTGQGVVLDHPSAKDFLSRDIKNIDRYFRSLGVDTTEGISHINKEMESIGISI